MLNRRLGLLLSSGRVMVLRGQCGIREQNDRTRECKNYQAHGYLLCRLRLNFVVSMQRGVVIKTVTNTLPSTAPLKTPLHQAVRDTLTGSE